MLDENVQEGAGRRFSRGTILAQAASIRTVRRAVLVGKRPAVAALRTLALGLPGVDGVILDSLVPLQDDAQADLSRRSRVTDAVGRRILAGCDASPPAAAPWANRPKTCIAASWRADKDLQLLAMVPGKNARRFFGSLIDMPGAAGQIPYLIKALDAGGATHMRAVTAQASKARAAFGDFPQTPFSMPLVITISGAENNLQPGRSVRVRSGD